MAEHKSAACEGRCLQANRLPRHSTKALWAFAPKRPRCQENVSFLHHLTWAEVGDRNVLLGQLGIVFTFQNCDFAFKVEDNVGINRKNATDAEVCLALYTEAISDEIKTVGDCYTGVKKSFLSAGIIDNYDDMPRGEAKDSISYFEENSERFRKLDVEEDDLKNLSAGKIVVFTKDGKAGHICITNGNGQAMSSSTDNMGWLDAEGDGADFVVYELTEGWQYNKETRKLEFTEP